MPVPKKVLLEKKYAFPLFTRPANSVPLAGNQKLVISDIWALWDYINKKMNFEQPFISSLIEQAKYFYNAAEDSPTKSQPLLFYYSFLNLAKVLINVNKRYGKGTYLYQHGISEINHGNFLLSEVEIQPLKLHVKNVAAELYQSLEDKQIATKTTIRIKDLLNHCVGIHRTYSELYSQREVFCRVHSMVLSKKGRVLSLESEIQCDDSKKTLLSNVGYNILKVDDKYIWKIDHMMANSTVTRNEYYRFSQEIRQKGLWYFLGQDGYVNYLSTNATNRFPPEIIIYYTMFYLGSITRYHPYLFDDIFSDKEQWLMSEFLKTQPKQFLYLVTAKILGQDVLKAYSAF